MCECSSGNCHLCSEDSNHNARIMTNATSEPHAEPMVAVIASPDDSTRVTHHLSSQSPSQSPKVQLRDNFKRPPDPPTNVRLDTSPPDGGWGWVVVFCSFMIHVIADGVTYTFGLFYIAILDEFKESKGKTAWIASILTSTTFCVGPIASALTNLYGCQAVTIGGSVLAAFGMFVSFWAPNVNFLIVSIGLCTGIGLGLMYLPAIVSVSMYFESKRAFATGIAVCGSGFGTFILAPIIEALVEYYGWRGALMITSGLLLNCVVFGALMRPPDYEYIEETAMEDIDNNTLYSNENTKGLADNLLKPSDANALSTDKSHHRSMCHLSVNSEPELMLIRTPSIDRNLYLEKDAPNFRHSYNSLKKRHSYTSQPSISVHSQTAKLTRAEQLSSFIKTICESIDLALLLKSPIFILFALSNFFTSIGFNVPYLYVADLAKRKYQIDDSKASLLLSFIGISNTASRVLLGYLSDKAFVNRILLYNLCIGTCGIGTAVSILCSSYSQFAFYCVVFGATSGAFISLTSVILVDLLGLEKLNNAFGLVLLFEGLAVLIGPPLTGWLYDVTGSYTGGFIFSGVVIAAGGVMLFLIPCVKHKDPIHSAQTADIGKTIPIPSAI